MSNRKDRVDWDLVISGRDSPSEEAKGSRQKRPDGDPETGSEDLFFNLVMPNYFALVLFLISWMGRNTWLAKSPLFDVLGCITCFVALLLYAIFGLVCWLVTGDKTVAAFAWKALPFAQPGIWRQLAGIMTVSLLVLPLLIRFVERFRHSVLTRRPSLIVPEVTFYLLLAAAVGSTAWRLIMD